ncbi:hypothetical protein OIE66_28635 [Nonomuraea sp. NBC_01738]|uniref:hypothetical protein n=1 Tax=Nonomuraea sp. NBC_01738 TaxID=2976003 RepID=UPI002E1430BA|nr:hypothetical protein OIE66_28635 [Nonomuraea sp. NBC_01738]
MSSQKVTVEAGFLRGDLAVRYLPTAALTPFTARRSKVIRAVETLGWVCSINPHIPACQPETSDCTGPGPEPTTSFCPTREFVC